MDDKSLTHSVEEVGLPTRQQVMALALARVEAKITPKSRDRYGRTVADVECRGQDPSEEQVRVGFAWYYVLYGKGYEYLQAVEREARAPHRGLIRTRCRGSGDGANMNAKLLKINTTPGCTIRFAQKKPATHRWVTGDFRQNVAVALVPQKDPLLLFCAALNCTQIDACLYQKCVNFWLHGYLCSKGATVSTQPKPTLRAAAKPLSIQKLSATTPLQEQQPQGLLFPITEVELDGVAMGVLSDGTPYLHLRGLARLCGVDSGMLSRLAGNWKEERSKPRGQRINDLLMQQGFNDEALHIITMGPGGETPVYTDAVCMALLEYYAFDAKQGSSEIAQRNYRLLARKSFRTFIYDGCGYNPNADIPESWRTFHERILLNDQLPVGFFPCSVRSQI